MRNWHHLLYLVYCVLALGYLAVANARGYVPFLGGGTQAVGGATHVGGGHFHK